MKTIALAATVVLCSAFGTSAQFRPLLDPSKPLAVEQIQQWAEAVEKHEQGRADEAAGSVAAWSGDQLYLLFNELRALEAFQKNPLVARGPVNGVRYAEAKYEKNIMLLLGLTPEERRTGNINRFLLRAAMLHTDAQFLARPPSIVIVNRGSPFSGQRSVMTEDGRQTGVTNVAIQVEFASVLLDGIRRDASTDSVVRSWYQAVSAQLQQLQRIGDAVWLLFRGRRLYQDDMILEFLSGTVEEMLAAPRTQASLRPPSPLSREPVQAQYNTNNLERAEQHFRKALEIYPGYVEARLHLGRVVGLQGQHPPAIELLTEAAGKTTLAEHRYYAALFLARELDANGALDDARRQYELAATLFPQAQTPLLALSELARRQGDSTAAQRPLQQLLALPNGPDRADPIWWYLIFHVADAQARVEQWREMAGGVRR